MDEVEDRRRHFDGFRGADARPWLLAIVRNSAWAWLGARRPAELVELDEDALGAALADNGPDLNPETLAMRRGERRAIDTAIAALRIFSRGTRTLCEREGLAHRASAHALYVPLGALRSRPSRA